MIAVWVVLSLLVPAGMALSPLVYRRTRQPAPPPLVEPVALINGQPCVHRLNPLTGCSYWAAVNEQRAHSQTPR